jgi:hypothetical protein
LGNHEATHLPGVFKTGNGETLGLAEGGAGFDGHVVGSDGSASEQSAVDFLNTTSVGVSTGRGGLVASVGVDLESVGS